MPKPFCPPGSEDDILKRLSLHFPDTPETLLIGRGDDCAMLRPGGPLCVSNDLFLEDVHFRRSYFTPEDVGYKALAVNISDLAACGARPQAFTLGLGLPDDVDVAWLDAFFAGMADAARPWRMALAGGDLSAPIACISPSLSGAKPTARRTSPFFWPAAGPCPATASFLWDRSALPVWDLPFWKSTAVRPSSAGPRPAPLTCTRCRRWTPV